VSFERARSLRERLGAVAAKSIDRLLVVLLTRVMSLDRM